MDIAKSCALARTMNSKEKTKSTASKSVEKKPTRIMPLMTPRTLVPSTPIRFNATELSTSTTSQTNRIIKGTQKNIKDKSNIPLAPGYFDRSAQRRSGTEGEALALSFEWEESLQKESNVQNQNLKQEILKNKLEFLEECSGLNRFPRCSNDTIEFIIKLILDPNSNSTFKTRTLIGKNDFRPSEAFLQFKSIEESKTQPYDPFSRPKKVFRASFKNSISQEVVDEDEVLNRVKEAMNRLKTSTERNQKYLQVLQKESGTFDKGNDYNTNEIKDFSVGDIFPDAGRFDERKELENKISSAQLKPIVSTKSKAKERLFASTKIQKSTTKKETEGEEEIDIFEMIAQKPLKDVKIDDDKQKKIINESGDGGLFGFSSVLPKLSRLEVVENSSSGGNGSGVKLSGAYASILSGSDEEADEENKSEEINRNRQELEEDDSLYPGYLENDPITHDSDDEDKGAGKEFISGKNKKRKLELRQDKEASKVEKLVKSKFGVDLLK